MFYWCQWKCSMKKLFLKVSHSHEKTCIGVSLQASWPETLLRGSKCFINRHQIPYTDVFHRILQNSWESLFWRFGNYCFLNSFFKEHYWTAASASLNLGNLLTDYKQYQIFSWTGSFEFLDQINPNRVFPI